jgi:hypothetical protein
MLASLLDCERQNVSRTKIVAKMTTAMLDRFAHHCDIIETGNELALQEPRLNAPEMTLPPICPRS